MISFSRFYDRRQTASVLALLFCSFFPMLLFLSGCSGDDAAPAPKTATLLVEDVRGARGERVSFPVISKDLPADSVIAVEWEMDFDSAEIDAVGVRAGTGSPVNSVVSSELEGEGRYSFRIEAPAGSQLGSGGDIAELTIKLPGHLKQRTELGLVTGTAYLADGSTLPLQPESATWAVAMISRPATLFAFLAGVVAMIYWLSTLKAMEGFFKFLPPLIWMYFVPMMMTTLGITPDASSLYSPFMSRIILPAILVLLLIPSDVRSIAQLGLKAVGMMLFATTGIVVGAIASFWLFTTLTPDQLPPDTWKGVASLSGSWIGGSPNMFAVLESVGTPPGIVGPLVVVDTVLAYSWLGLLIALSAYQHRIDKYHRADSRVIDEISARLEAEQEAHARAPKTADIAFMFGLAFVVSQVCVFLGGPIYTFMTESLGLEALSEIINAYGWGILLITAVGLLLSTTRVRQLDFCGASSLGYVGLYLLLTTYGAQANLKAVLELPVFFALGFVWLVIHVTFLYVGFRVLKAPIFLAATSSMANIGGTASAPVVAASYNQSMAPVGLLMAILGSVMGTPLALFVVATTCRAIAGG